MKGDTTIIHSVTQLVASCALSKDAKGRELATLTIGGGGQRVIFLGQKANNAVRDKIWRTQRAIREIWENGNG